MSETVTTPIVEADLASEAIGPVPAKPPAEPIVFVARERYEAMTFVKQLAGVAADLAREVVAELDKLTHTGPVHVTMWPDQGDGEPPSFCVRPFSFVKV